MPAQAIDLVVPHHLQRGRRIFVGGLRLTQAQAIPRAPVVLLAGIVLQILQQLIEHGDGVGCRPM